MNIIELGCPGHFVGASECRWRRHTQVGNYRISSVGNYFPKGVFDPENKEREPLSAPDYFFETMVFETTDKPDPENEGCGCKEVKDWDWQEIERDLYKTAKEAQDGHEEMVKKYLEKIEEKE